MTDDVVTQETPNIVKEFSIGNTRIKIADNYCRNMTPEQVKKILRNIARTALTHFKAAVRA